MSLTVWGVFYTPDFNEQLESLHTTKELATQAVSDRWGEEMYGPFDPSSGYTSAEEEFKCRLKMYQVEIRELVVDPEK